MPTVHLPRRDGRLVGSQQWFEEFTLHRPHKKPLGIHTDAAVRLLASSLEVADRLLRELADKDGPHQMAISQRKRHLVGALSTRSQELLAEMTREYGTDSHDAMNRLSALLLQAGYVVTQLHDTDACEDWIATGNELASKLLLARYGGESRADRVTTYRELLQGLLTLPEAALDQPLQGSADMGEFWRLASIDILSEEHVQVSDYDLDRFNHDQSYADSKQYPWEATHGYRPLSEVPEALREGRPRLAPGTVMLRTTRPTTDPLHQGELLPDIAPEHRTEDEIEQLVAARAAILAACHQDPKYMATALPQLDRALLDQPGIAPIRPAYGFDPTEAMPYLTQHQELAVPAEKLAEFPTELELVNWQHDRQLRQQALSPEQIADFTRRLNEQPILLGCDFGINADGDDFSSATLYRRLPDGSFQPLDTTRLNPAD